MSVPKEQADEFRKAAAQMKLEFEARGNMRNQMCECGDCQAHWNRARKIIDEIIAEGGCAKSIAQIAGAMSEINGLAIMIITGKGVDWIEAMEADARRLMSYRSLCNPELALKVVGKIEETVTKLQ